MRANRSLVLSAAALVSCALLAGCAGGSAPSPSLITMAPLAPPAPTAALATPAPAMPTAAATPAPTMDPALVGTWTGDLMGVHGPVEKWKVSHTIVGPCAVVDEQCGSWEMRGPVSAELGWAPWAVLGEEVACKGQLLYQGSLDSAYVFLAALTSTSRADGAGCGVWMHRLGIEAVDTVRVEVTAPGTGVGSKAKWGYGTLHRGGVSPGPAASQ